jgi:hypothetical protein
MDGGGMHDKVRVFAFAKYIQKNGDEKMMDCLERNEKAGIVYHCQGQLIGDYDKCGAVDEVMKMLEGMR